MIKKLTRDQAEIVALLAANYADYKMALSNADHYFVAYHGEYVLNALALLDFKFPFPAADVRAAVKAAQERLDYAEYRESQS